MACVLLEVRYSGAIHRLPGLIRQGNSRFCDLLPVKKLFW